jgi:hypothetical protein
LSEPLTVRNKVILALSGIVCLLMVVFLVNYFWHYATEHPKGEIQRVFEDGVKKYRDQLIR